jgi:hypothetical protein
MFSSNLCYEAFRLRLVQRRRLGFAVVRDLENLVSFTTRLQGDMS